MDQIDSNLILSMSKGAKFTKLAFLNFVGVKFTKLTFISTWMIELLYSIVGKIAILIAVV